MWNTYVKWQSLRRTEAARRWDGRGATTTGDLLLDFEHAQIPFRLVIRKGYGQVMDKGEYLRGMSTHRSQQILRWRAFAARRQGIAGLAGFHPVPEGRFPGCQFIGRNASLLPPVLRCLIHRQQRRLQLSNPGFPRCPASPVADGYDTAHAGRRTPNSSPSGRATRCP